MYNRFKVPYFCAVIALAFCMTLVHIDSHGVIGLPKAQASGSGSGDGGGDGGGKDENGNRGKGKGAEGIDEGDEHVNSGSRVKFRIKDKNIKIQYPNGTTEEVSNNIYMMTDSYSRTIVKRNSTAADFNRLVSIAKK